MLEQKFLASISGVMQSLIKKPSTLLRLYAGSKHFDDLLSATCLSASDFLIQYVPLSERLAVCVQELPLMPDIFKASGGALQCGLQAGLLAVRACDAIIFEPRATAQERQKNDPAYRWLAYCAALATVYLICAGQVTVKVEGEKFSFAGKNPLGHHVNSDYSAKWEESAIQLDEAGLIYLQAFFFPGQFAHLDPSMIAMLGGAINPSQKVKSNESSLARIVRSSITTILNTQRKNDEAIIDLSSNPSGLMDMSPPEMADVNPASDSSTAEKSVINNKKTENPENNLVNNIPQKIKEWVCAIAMNRGLDSSISIEGENIRIEKNAMGYGASPADNYKMLYDAGFVLSKGERSSTVCKKPIFDIYTAAKAKSITQTQ